MKRVLVLDGGGAKGVMQSIILKEIEERIGKPIHQIFDLIVGTSVGAVLGAISASGQLPASECHSIIKKNLSTIFKKRFFRFPRYSRKPLLSIFEKHIGSGFLMGHCKTPFVCTAVNMVDGKTHYFKSWERRDSRLPLVDAVLRSSAAPFFFGAIKDEISQSVWMDGGVGNANNPLLEAIIETIRQEWLDNDRVHVLNIGTGYHLFSLNFTDAVKAKTLKQLSFYLNPSTGGLARNQSVQSRVAQVNALSQLLENLTYQRLDTPISERLDKLDGVKFVDDYEKIGHALAADINWDHLTDNKILSPSEFTFSSQMKSTLNKEMRNAL